MFEDKKELEIIANYKVIKNFIFLILLFLLFFYSFILKINYDILNINYLAIANTFNLTIINKNNKKIKLAVYAFCIKNGGRARVTSLLINYLIKIKLFELFLFTKIEKEENEYKIPQNIPRIIIKDNIIKIIKKKRIDILIYQLSFYDEIKLLNNLKNIKVIFYQHLSIFDWIYGNYTQFKYLYKNYRNSKYVVSIVPLENDYIFKKWGINSILMNNFITYDYKKIISSNLLSKTILMLGRADAKKKRFHIGINAMEYIINEIPQCKMLIISEFKGLNKLINLIDNLNLKNNIIFNGYTSMPEIYFKNISLNIFPSISEAFPMVICETEIYGIPNIIIGIDYITVTEKGIEIIYDDIPEVLAIKSMNLLKNYEYRKILGIEGRKNMKRFNNDLLLIKWIKLILSIYNGEIYFEMLKRSEKQMTKNNSLYILNNQINLLKTRKSNFKNISISDFENFNFMENLK
jgi:glycosyltransferase involved in cell wall biosynthesis